MAAGPPIVNGKIVKYLWTSNKTGEVLLASDKPVLTYEFSIGKTILHLEVIDNTGDSATASTYVDIRKPAFWEKNPPHLLKITPDLAPTYGGSLVTVRGYGFYNEPVIKFGKKVATIVTSLTNTELVVECPPGEGNTTVTVSNNFGDGVGDSLNFSYFQTDLPPIRFRDDTVKDGAGRDYFIPEVTSIAIGPDGLYYASSLNGFIHVLNISKGMQVLSHCKSASVGDSRGILGIAFHPSDVGERPKAFITTATLYWKTKKTGARWNNGKIEVWQSGANSSDCIGHVTDIVTGLPTSNHDHSASAISFTNNGDMLVSNAGTTNAGVHTHNDGVGGVPESPLSAAILRFKLSRGENFDGDILYDMPDNPEFASVQSGDVEIFSSGVRNCFGLVTHSNEKIYGTSNGANSGFGRSSKDCATVGDSVSAQDALMNLKLGHYYGSPNRNRGRHDGRQCSWVHPRESPGPLGFTRAMAMLRSSTNGIAEYTANTFEGQLRGDIFLSKFSFRGPRSGGTVTRVELSKDGENIERRTEVWHDGGLSVVMTPHGDLMMPKIKHGVILVLRPVREIEGKISVLAVAPCRGPDTGGYTVFVTGEGFREGIEVRFGKAICENMYFAEDGTSLRCVVPRGVSGTRVAVVAQARDGRRSKRYDGGDFLYTDTLRLVSRKLEIHPMIAPT